MMKRMSIKDRRAANGQRTSRQEGQGVAAYTGTLGQPEKIERVKVTLRMPADVAYLLDEVYGRERIRKGSAANKGDLAAEGLRPFLEARRQELLQWEREHLVDMPTD